MLGVMDVVVVDLMVGNGVYSDVSYCDGLRLWFGENGGEVGLVEG